MVCVRFLAAGQSFDGLLRDSPIATALAQRLPIDATAMRWGDEIYFDAPVKMANTAPTRQVRVGDIGYWPDGPCLCVFFGKTPASKENEPRPASDVTIIGHTDASPALLRAIAEGARIRVEAHPHASRAAGFSARR